MVENSKMAEGGGTVREELYDWLQSIVLALVVCVLVFVFFGRLIDVIGTSMVPTLADGDKVIVSDVLYTPKQGDVVVFYKEAYGDNCLVKRIIAMEGQTVDIDFENGVVYVDGEIQDEPYIAEPTHERESFEGPVTVPPGCVFVMGDNRNASTDSRYALIAFPLKDFGSVYDYAAS